MIEETATVVGEEEAGFVWVETQRQSTCGACSVNKACGTASLAKVLGQRRTRVRAINRLGVHAGEAVVIGLNEQALVRGSLAVYAVPLLALLAGALFGEYLGARLLLDSPELMSVLFGLAGLAGGLFWLRIFSRHIHDDVRYQPVVLRRLGRSDQGAASV